MRLFRRKSMTLPQLRPYTSARTIPSSQVTKRDLADPNVSVEWEDVKKHPWELGCATCQQAAETRVEELEERLRLNTERLTRAIRAVPGFSGFSGTPESAVGTASTIVERYAEQAPLRPRRLKTVRKP